MALLGRRRAAAKAEDIGDCIPFERTVACEYHQALNGSPVRTEPAAKKIAQRVGKKNKIPGKTVQDIYFKALSKRGPLNWLNVK